LAKPKRPYPESRRSRLVFQEDLRTSEHVKFQISPVWHSLLTMSYRHPIPRSANLFCPRESPRFFCGGLADTHHRPPTLVLVRLVNLSIAREQSSTIPGYCRRVLRRAETRLRRKPLSGRFNTHMAPSVRIQISGHLSGKWLVRHNNSDR